MANVIFKTSTNKTIDDLFNWNKNTGVINPNPNVPIVPGTIYFTSDEHIVFDTTNNDNQNVRLWMGKNAYSAIYAQDINDTTDISNVLSMIQMHDNLIAITSNRGDLRSTVTPRYLPYKWYVSLDHTPSDGEILLIKTPSAVTTAGVYLSIEGDIEDKYHPIAIGGTTRLTTQYSSGDIIFLTYQANKKITCYPLNPVDNNTIAYNNENSPQGIWRILNYYDSNTNTLLRTYALNTNKEYPLVGLSTNTDGSIPATHTSSYKDLYGMIPSSNKATINLSTGKISASGGFQGNLTGNATTASALTNLSSNDNASNNDTWRKIWLSYSDGLTGRPALSDGLLYQASSKKLKTGALHLTNTEAATTTTLSSQLIIGNSTNATGLELYRGSGASWQIINHNGTFKIRNNWHGNSSNSTNYDIDALKIDFTSGNLTTSGAITAKGTSNYGGLILYKEGTSFESTTEASCLSTGINFQFKHTTKNKTYNGAFIGVVCASDYNGANMFINPGGNLYLGGGEGASNLYNAHKGVLDTETTPISENTYLLADSLVYVYSQCQTIANRIGFMINASGHIVPQKTEGANNNKQNLGVSDNKWANVYATNFKGNADTATAANITSTTNAIAYYTNITGTFGSKASADGALYATSANGSLNWGTLPVAQGGTGQTTLSTGEALIGNAQSGIATRQILHLTTQTDIGWYSGANKLIDQSTIAYWTGAYLTTSSNLQYFKNAYFDSSGNFIPRSVTNLGTSSYRWGALYIGTANSYGATNTPIYWNNGVPATINLNLTANNLINNLSTGYSIPVDNDYFISQYVEGGTSTITYHRRPISKLYEYIRNKAATSTSGMYSIIPTTNNTYSLGSSSFQWKEIYGINIKSKHFQTQYEFTNSANIVGSSASGNNNLSWFTVFTSNPSDEFQPGTRVATDLPTGNYLMCVQIENFVNGSDQPSIYFMEYLPWFTNFGSWDTNEPSDDGKAPLLGSNKFKYRIRYRSGYTQLMIAHIGKKAWTIYPNNLHIKMYYLGPREQYHSGK